MNPLKEMTELQLLRLLAVRMEDLKRAQQNVNDINVELNYRVAKAELEEITPDDTKQ